MVGLLIVLVTFTILVAAALAVLVAVTVVPMFVTLQMAEARRFSTARWAAVSAATVLVGLASAYSVHKHHGKAAVLPLALTWVAPGMLWLLEQGQTRWGGRAGLHE
jgi:hypothetical protein